MKFTEAVEIVKTLSVKPDDATLSLLYGLYKQSTIGNCNISQPYIWELTARAKYDAWYSNLNKPVETAQTEYIKLVEKLVRADIKRMKQKN